jgi:hypothetical protein
MTTKHPFATLQEQKECEERLRDEKAAVAKFFEEMPRPNGWTGPLYAIYCTA